eukprot:4136929-Prymnesium_polylepis.2
MPLSALFYGNFLRGWGVPVTEWNTQFALVKRIPEFELPLILIQLGSILCFVALAVGDGDLWFDSTIRKRPDAHAHDAAKEQADVLVETLAGAITVAVLGGVACSVTR